jgi:enoyl-CoA hydratase/3-hydroxyacyl-CoA dehydrogenase
MNRIGIDKTYAAVAAISEKYPDFKVPELLKKQKQLGKPFEFNFVDVAVKDGIATLTLNRPEAMNALNEQLVAQLGSRFAEVESRADVKAIVIQGAGKAFVAGADIRYFVNKIKAERIPDIEGFTRKGHEVFLKIENSPKITIALLDGLSMGGGSELALACQAIVATFAGSMAFPETGIGIYPGLGGMLRLTRQVGSELAKYYVFTGAPISAQDAKDLGIVQKLVEPADIPDAIQSLVSEGRPDKYRSRNLPDKFKPLADMFAGSRVASWLTGKLPEGVSADSGAKTLKTIGFKAPLALKISAEIIDRQQGKSMADAIEIELGNLSAIFATADAFEGLSTAGRKRPEFKGA